jgi:PAS domain S-box-containing protein
VSDRPLAHVLTRLIDALDDGAIVVRLRDARVLDANDAQAGMLGYARDELVGRSAVELGVWRDPAELTAIADAVREALGSGAVRPQLQATMRTRSGEERVVEMSPELVELDGEDCLAAVTRFVGATDHRLAEQALRASEQRYRAIVETASDGVWMVDDVDRTSFVNRAMAEMLGYEVHEMLGRRAVEFMAADFNPVGRRALDRRRQGISERYEMKFQRKDGSEVWVEMSATPLMDESGRYAGAVSMAADMTVRREAQLEREQLEVRLQQSQRLETVGQLAGGIAHDFNNLLAVILNYAYFIREQLPPDGSVRQDMEEIRHAAERASELTHRLLVFSRREPVLPEVLDLNAVVRDMERLLRRTLAERVSLDVALAPGEPLVEADAAQLEQVVLNLVMNARDAMPEGGTIRIETSRTELGERRGSRVAGPPPGEYVVLSVRDEGAGMEQEVAARAFEPFFTTKPKGEGTGLGLATVYGTVTHAGGGAEIASEPGKGTTVQVYLPAVAERRPQPDERPAPAHHDGAGATILLVEDEDAVRRLTARILRAGGFECLDASGGEEALRVYEANRGRIALLLTDVAMPGMSGADVAARIGADGSGPPVLFMSGYTDDPGVGRSLPAGAAEMVRKPFTAESLLDSVRQAIGEPAP